MGYFMVNIQLPDAASIQRSDVIARQIEDILYAHEEDIRYVTTATGFSLLSNSMAPNGGFLFVTTTDWSERDKTVTEIVQELNMEFRQKIKGAAVFAFGPPAIPGLGNGSGFTMMLQDRIGNTPAYLSAEATKFIAAAQQRPEIGSIFTTYRSNTPQRYLDIDIDKALKMGVPLGDLYNTIGAFLGGTYVSDFNRFGRLYKAFIQAEPEYRLNADKLNLFFIRNNKGENVPLATLITVRESSGPDYTVRFNLMRSVELTGQPAAGYSSANALDALEEVAAEVLPQGVGYAWANMSYQEKMAEIEAQMNDLELHIEDGTLDEIHRQISEQVEAHMEQFEEIHVEMEPFLDDAVFMTGCTGKFCRIGHGVGICGNDKLVEFILELQPVHSRGAASVPGRFLLVRLGRQTNGKAQSKNKCQQ
jgi:HAE1 family hydrophobic/amphiphilic exporter-1